MSLLRKVVTERGTLALPTLAPNACLVTPVALAAGLAALVRFVERPLTVSLRCLAFAFVMPRRICALSASVGANSLLKSASVLVSGVR